MSDSSIASAGQRVVELFEACGGSPDDIEVGRAADRALRDLDLALGATSDSHPAPAD